MTAAAFSALFFLATAGQAPPMASGQAPPMAPGQAPFLSPGQGAAAQRLENERAAARQLAGREAGLLGHLAELERQVELEQRALKAAQQRLRLSTGRFAASDAKAKLAQADVARASDAVGPRLIARYRLGREGYLRFLLGARTLGDVLRRKRLFSAILEADLDALAMLRFTADGTRAARDELFASRKELADSAQAEADRRTALEGKVSQQKRVLAAVQGERALHEQAVHELEEAARELQERLGEIEKTPEPVGPPSAEAQKLPIRKARGKLLFPVEKGHVEVHFGRAVDRQFGTVTLQRGIDVRAPQGTKVHAVWPGKVVHAGWFKGYGNLLVVDHGDGIFSLMAHLEALEKAVGDELQLGTEVGTVGETGSLKGAYLYFELRDGQKPLDPERWLSRSRKVASLVSASPGVQPSASAKAR